ncbi:hypothetical protein BCR44DRAFT_35625 [Catenaria anguillulae PL171]|uniref:Secreted protein n=1 Tax=Catenaria anguillulae PL171 TaxID=765915 RepID=A0A1Y2HHE9_9FUNG|nr:hypothetical protein BCR44DRAFT_35625 [Catenaria anguillulae PL171]
MSSNHHCVAHSCALSRRHFLLLLLLPQAQAPAANLQKTLVATQLSTLPTHAPCLSWYSLLAQAAAPSSIQALPS